MEQVFVIAALILSIVIHEVAHGHMANWLGDPTARLQGRLSANPLAHIDPLGSVILPALLYFGNAGILFGWAKPVPYNPYNLRNQKWGEALVALAGPGVNFLLAIIFALIVRLSPMFELSTPFTELAYTIVHINVLLALFNLLPIPPLDGSKILMSVLPFPLAQRYRALVLWTEQYGLFAMFAFIFLFLLVLSAPFFTLVEGVVRFLVGV